MKPEMRQKLAREPFVEKIRKVAQLIRLAKTFPRRSAKSPRGVAAHPGVGAQRPGDAAVQFPQCRMQ